MLKTDKLVTLPVDEESRTFNLGHHINVAETVIYDVLQHVAGFLPDDVSNGHERAHEEESSWLPQCGQ